MLEQLKVPLLQYIEGALTYSHAVNGVKTGAVSMNSHPWLSFVAYQVEPETELCNKPIHRSKAKIWHLTALF